MAPSQSSSPSHIEQAACGSRTARQSQGQTVISGTSGSVIGSVRAAHIRGSPVAADAGRHPRGHAAHIAAMASGVIGPMHRKRHISIAVGYHDMSRLYVPKLGYLVAQGRAVSQRSDPLVLAASRAAGEDAVPFRQGVYVIVPVLLTKALGPNIVVVRTVSAARNPNHTGNQCSG
ncbi:hypothetical protein D1872_241120 [compost metagenome]